MVPELGWWTPARILMSVDLPAPLSPTRATTSPACTSSSMSVRAETAPNFLVMLRRLRMGFPLAGVVAAASVIPCVLFSRGWTRPERSGRAMDLDSLLGDAELLAAFGIFTSADLL